MQRVGRVRARREIRSGGQAGGEMTIVRQMTVQRRITLTSIRDRTRKVGAEQAKKSGPRKRKVELGDGK